MNSIPWQPAPVFKLALFFNARGTEVKEKSFSRLSPRESTEATDGVGSANTQADL